MKLASCLLLVLVSTFSQAEQWVEPELVERLHSHPQKRSPKITAMIEKLVKIEEANAKPASEDIHWMEPKYAAESELEALKDARTTNKFFDNKSVDKIAKRVMSGGMPGKMPHREMVVVDQKTPALVEETSAMKQAPGDSPALQPLQNAPLPPFPQHGAAPEFVPVSPNHMSNPPVYPPLAAHPMAGPEYIDDIEHESFVSPAMESPMLHHYSDGTTFPANMREFDAWPRAE